MKRIICILLVSILCFSAVFALSACGEETVLDDGQHIEKPETEPEPSLLDKQIESATDTFENIYSASKRKGGLLGQGAVKTSSAALDEKTESDSSFERIKDVIFGYEKSFPSFENVARSYVSDIYSYSQVQLSIINKYSESALIGNYRMDYSDVDWSVFNSFGTAAWFVRIHSNTASFPGVDLETGRVYCKETHITSSNAEADTYIEYYYESDENMGVTTLNWKKDSNGTYKSFEYHFFDFGSNIIMQAYYNIFDGAMELIAFNAQYPGNKIYNKEMSENDSKMIESYILSEIDRIPETADKLAEQNKQIAADEGIEIPDEMRDVPITYDVDVLRSMLGEA